MTSQTVRTIGSQLTSLGLVSKAAFIAIDDETLRVHSKHGRNVRNVDIRYVAGDDLYEVSVHTFRSSEYNVTTKTTVGVFAEDLINFFPDRMVLHLHSS